ncbi:protein kinase domain-containing protein [Nonomuraea roseola]|uniref:non-specific serine/threonine protein kinase n=1 Tax=Nonomuraea roseola TaxID=46179 RepID=A0ABV5PPE7_9ACTN
MNPHEGELLARRYELQERIATGGMSVVWRAFDRSLHRTVAIKLLAGPFSCDREIIRREARAAARLVHPDVIEVYDYGETVTPGGRLAAYVVMRLLDGPSLADRIASGPLPWPEAVTVAGRLAGVLAAAHAQGIVHCDVTPANVLLTSDGAKLLDFGIAAPAGSSYEELSGTPPYVAPERLAGAPADPAVDVYALGVVLFEMLTGRLPYPETTWEDVAAARHHGPAPVPEGAPGVVAGLCRACLSPDPARRPTSREAAAVLRSACSREGTHPAPSSVAGAPKGARKVRGWSARATMTAGALLLSGAALTVATGYGLPDATPWMALPLPISTATGEPALPASPKGSPPANAPSVTPSPRPGSGLESSRVSDPIGTEKNPPVEPPAANPDPERLARASAAPPSTADPVGRAAAAAPRPTVEEAVAEFNDALDRGLAGASIRYDVALDLRQVLANLARSGSGDLEQVRVKLHDRRREGVLATDLLRVLDRHLGAVENALRAR